MQLQHFEFRKKIPNTYVYLRYNIFSKENIYQNLYINNGKLQLSKFQHKITGKPCGVGKF